MSDKLKCILTGLSAGLMFLFAFSVTGSGLNGLELFISLCVIALGFII